MDGEEGEEEEDDRTGLETAKVPWTVLMRWRREWLGRTPAALAAACLGAVWPRRMPELPGLYAAASAAQAAIVQGRSTQLMRLLPNCAAIAAASSQGRIAGDVLPPGNGMKTWGDDMPPPYAGRGGGLGSATTPLLAASFGWIGSQQSSDAQGCLPFGVWQRGGRDKRADNKSNVTTERGCWGDVRFGVAARLADLVGSASYGVLSPAEQLQQLASCVDECGSVPFVTPLAAVFLEMGALSSGKISISSLTAAGCIVRGADLLNNGSSIRRRLLGMAWASARHAPALAQVFETMGSLGSLACLTELTQLLPDSPGITDARLRTLRQHSAAVHNPKLSSPERDAEFAAVLNANGLSAAAEFV